MAFAALPDGVIVTAESMRLVFPGMDHLENRYSGRIFSYDTGAVYFEGQTTLEAKDSNPTVYRKLMAWIDCLKGGGIVGTIPIETAYVSGTAARFYTSTTMRLRSGQAKSQRVEYGTEFSVIKSNRETGDTVRQFTGTDGNMYNLKDVWADGDIFKVNNRIYRVADTRLFERIPGSGNLVGATNFAVVPEVSISPEAITSGDPPVTVTNWFDASIRRNASDPAITANIRLRGRSLTDQYPVTSDYGRPVQVFWREHI